MYPSDDDEHTFRTGSDGHVPSECSSLEAEIGDTFADEATSESICFPLLYVTLKMSTDHHTVHHTNKLMGLPFYYDNSTSKMLVLVILRITFRCC